MGESLTTTAPAGLPDLVPTSTMDIGAGDVTFPRIKIAHPSQTFVTDGVVPAFAIYQELNRDDDNKITLFALPKGKDKPDLEKDPDAGVLFHVIAMKRGKSASVLGGQVVQRNTPGSEFRSWSYDDPTAPSGAGVDVTVNYVLYTPELDDAEQPHRLLLTRTSTSTARTLNTLIQLAERRGQPAYTLAFRLTSERRERDADGQTQRWGIFKIRQVEAASENVQAASAMTALVNELTANSRVEPTGAAQADEPAI
jgi:hypothetical protein